MKKKIAVLGAGVWGKTLLQIFEDNGHEVTLVSHRGPIDRYAELSYVDWIVFAVASQYLDDLIFKLKDVLNAKHCIIQASKGFDEKTDLTGYQLLQLRLGRDWDNRLFVLSGPNIASEIQMRLPAVSVLAGLNGAMIQDLQKAFSNAYFRVYGSRDPIGVQLGGSLKNVIAIAAGICDGMKLGENAKASLMIRGIWEIAALAEKMGARRETLFGISGLGDLMTTAQSVRSRNHQVGFYLSQGKKLPEILDRLGQVAEGVSSVKAVLRLAQKFQIQMPISQAVHEILYENKEIKSAFHQLMQRELRFEDSH